MNAETVVNSSNNPAIMYFIGALLVILLIGLLADAIIMARYPEFTQEHADKKRQEAEASKEHLSQQAAAMDEEPASADIIPFDEKKAA